METNKSKELGSADLWLKAAYEVLIESGVDAIKVMSLANRLNLSRTSFYWHFSSRKALLNALVENWELNNTKHLIQQTEAYAETITEATLNLFDCWVDSSLFDSRLDFAIRNWAQISSKLKETVRVSDQLRISAIKDMLIRFTFSNSEAEVRAHAIYYTQMGYISMMVEETTDERILRIPEYIEIFTGKSPSDLEFARFKARHQ